MLSFNEVAILRVDTSGRVSCPLVLIHWPIYIYLEMPNPKFPNKSNLTFIDVAI